MHLRVFTLMRFWNQTFETVFCSTEGSLHSLDIYRSFTCDRLNWIMLIVSYEWFLLGAFCENPVSFLVRWELLTLQVIYLSSPYALKVRDFQCSFKMQKQGSGSAWRQSLGFQKIYLTKSSAAAAYRLVFRSSVVTSLSYIKGYMFTGGCKTASLTNGRANWSECY